MRIPFRSREILGFVWSEAKEAPKGLKKITKVCDETSLFDVRTLQFYERAAAYYGLSLGDLLSLSLPKKIQEGAAPLDLAPKHFVSDLFPLSEAQLEIAKSIQASKKFEVHLLRGEMGSGKTEIYLWLIERVLLEGGQALVLVPEISLTPQLEERLSSRLGGEVSVFHSQRSEKKRFEAFSRALSGQADVILGARSALFLPFSNLRLIIVDEEHDSSYKQSERESYHARDLALLKAQLLDVPIILGSATPSLETYQRSLDAKSPIYKLEPYYPKPHPQIEIVDLKKEWAERRGDFFSSALTAGLERQLEKSEQSLLFLNRRGSASQRICISCGATDECKNCSVSLTVHQDLNRALCHWCEFQRSLDEACQTCGSREFFSGGIGTKEVEAQLKARFPEARIARLDRDEAQKKNVMELRLKDFQEGKIDILIGTQMISKGIDIAGLSFVGVLLADLGWGLPDFRAVERSYQLLRQLLGRAGRRGQASSVVIQTFSPEHPLFGWLSDAQSYEVFAQSELKIRQQAHLPPFSRLALMTLSHKSDVLVAKESEVFSERLQKMASSLGIQVLGPTPAPVHRFRGDFRYHILLKSQPKGHLSTLIQAALDDWDKTSFKAKLKLDRDPHQFL